MLEEIVDKENLNTCNFPKGDELDIGRNPSLNSKLNHSKNLYKLSSGKATTKVAHSKKQLSVNPKSNYVDMIIDNDVEISTKEIEAVNYTDFENLQELDISNLDQIRLILENLNSSDWLAQFKALDDLRRLNKYCKNLFFESFDQFVTQIKDQASSLKSYLSKNTIILLKEVCNNRDERIPLWVATILNILVKSYNSPKKIISSEAEAALKNLTENLFYEETVFSLLDICSDSNLKYSKTSADHLLLLLNNCEENFLHLLNWRKFFSLLIFIYKKNSDHYQKICFTIIKKLSDRLKNNFDVTINKAYIDSSCYELVKNPLFSKEDYVMFSNSFEKVLTCFVDPSIQVDMTKLLGDYFKFALKVVGKKKSKASIVKLPRKSNENGNVNKEDFEITIVEKKEKPKET